MNSPSKKNLLRELLPTRVIFPKEVLELMEQGYFSAEKLDFFMKDGKLENIVGRRSLLN